ncbi:hypothetical protein STTU_4494 [Streptomyces sp. Tu6071]|nr:hypothetical protein STTU_4494 [Streptomyces sp. Tu6071]
MNEYRRGPRQHVVRVLREAFDLLFRRSSAVCWSGEVRGRPWLCGVVAVATAVRRFSPGTASRAVPGSAGA